jgi:hypothetical protein
MMAAAARPRPGESGALRRLREAERRRLSRALHDETGPLLCAAGLTAGLLRNTPGAATPQQEELFAKLSAALEAAVASVRRLSQEAAPGLAARHGIEGALRLLAEAHGAELCVMSPPRLPPAPGEALCELVRDVLLVQDRGPARITADAHGVRIEAPQPVDQEMEDLFLASACDAGLEFSQRMEAEAAIIELRRRESK